MKIAFKRWWIVLFFCAFFNEINAQGLTLPGGRGLIHLSSAWNLEKGGITVHGYTSSYFQNSKIKKSNGFISGITYWDVQGALTLHYASGRHTEWVMTQIVYQDNHKGRNANEFNAPDDLFLKIKIGSIGSSTSKFKFGFTIGTRIPLGSESNLILEPYSSERLEAGVITLVTYSPDPIIPESAFNLHLNLGFWYHNDTGKYLVSGPPNDLISVIEPTSEFLYGIGFAFPLEHFDLSLELTGQAFFKRPPVTAYGREDFIYLTPGIKYRPSRWFSLLAGLDLRLSDFKDTTLYQNQGTTLPRINESLANYPFWRLRFGTQINLIKPAPQLPPTVEFSKFGSNNGQKNKFKIKKDELKKQLSENYELTKERLKTESATEELEQMREERRRMELIIARLRKILDIEKKENQKQTDEKLTQKKP